MRETRSARQRASEESFRESSDELFEESPNPLFCVVLRSLLLICLRILLGTPSRSLLMKCLRSPVLSLRTHREGRGAQRERWEKETHGARRRASGESSRDSSRELFEEYPNSLVLLF